MKLKNRGFTLVELLVVIGIVGILLAITLVAINPARQFAQANNAKRSADVNAILNAITTLKIDNAGVYPSVVPSLTTTDTSLNSTNFVSLCSAVVTDYIAELPLDPTYPGAAFTDCTSFETGYTVREEDGRVTVTAPGAQEGASIAVTR
jgi:prepilin-type N-terminal cleavage/methylation domain-containing protein